MPFKKEEVSVLLAKCHRRCFIWHRFCGIKIETIILFQKIIEVVMILRMRFHYVLNVMQKFTHIILGTLVVESIHLMDFKDIRSSGVNICETTPSI